MKGKNWSFLWKDKPVLMFYRMFSPPNSCRPSRYFCSKPESQSKDYLVELFIHELLRSKGFYEVFAEAGLLCQHDLLQDDQQILLVQRNGRVFILKVVIDALQVYFVGETHLKVYLCLRWVCFPEEDIYYIPEPDGAIINFRASVATSTGDSSHLCLAMLL